MAATRKSERPRNELVFQSLFWWIGDGGSNALRIDRWVFQAFQSLFWWIGDGGPF